MQKGLVLGHCWQTKCDKKKQIQKDAFFQPACPSVGGLWWTPHSCFLPGWLVSIAPTTKHLSPWAPLCVLQISDIPHWGWRRDRLGDEPSLATRYAALPAAIPVPAPLDLQGQGLEASTASNSIGRPHRVNGGMITEREGRMEGKQVREGFPLVAE